MSNSVKNQNIYALFIFISILVSANWYFTGNVIPTSDNSQIWFHAGLLTLLIGKFVIEYRMTSPNDVFANCLIVFVSVSTLSNPPLADWWIALKWLAAICGTAGLILAWDQGREARLIIKPIRLFLFRLLTRIGSAEVIFSLVFILAILSYFDLESPQTRFFVIFWGVVLLSSKTLIPALQAVFRQRAAGKDRKLLGIAQSFLAPSIVFVDRTSDDRSQIHDIVGFSQTPNGPIHVHGMVLGERSSTNENRVVVGLIGNNLDDSVIDGNSCLVTLSESEQQELSKTYEQTQFNDIKAICGTVSSGTNISRLNFEIFGKPVLSAGSLLTVRSREADVYYQVFDGVTEEEKTLNDSSRAFTSGYAEQVGTWDGELCGFRSFDWVASERGLVTLLDQNMEAPKGNLAEDDLEIGNIPNSKYPVVINLNDLILYHSAILGVTGSGKSYLTFSIVEAAAATGVKVLCIDPSGDYQRHLAGASIVNTVGSLDAFLASNGHQIAIIETATSDKNPIIQARLAAKKCLEYCQKIRSDDDILHPKPKILIVMEEAHLLVPEWNFNVSTMTSEVNATSQIVLQARKYGLGFLIVSQRTANVVKSILNQCNTMITFQAFDETGFDFLQNYMGSYHVKALPSLKERHGIIVGKASKSQRPVLVKFKDQDRKLQTEPAHKMPIQKDQADRLSPKVS